jgi:hypothetical protein
MLNFVKVEGNPGLETFAASTARSTSTPIPFILPFIIITQDLKRQAELLDTAIEKLRAVIKGNFTLDEVLSSSRRLPEW